MATLWKCVAEPSGNPPGLAHSARRTHYVRTHERTSDKIDAPAACATLSATRPFHFVHTAWVLQREREMLASTCLYSLYARFVFVAAWLSGSTLVSINEVTLRRARG